MNSTNDSLKFIVERQHSEFNGITTKFHRKGFGEVIPAWDIATTTLFAGRSGEGNI